MISLQINRGSNLALYRQISEHVKTEISNGRLPANTQLPTVRALAKMLGVTRLTVQNAYSELRADGWVEATVGRGTFVSPSVQPYRLEPTVGQYLTPDNAINDMMQINQVVGVRSMAMARPDTTLFPVEPFWRSMEKIRFLDKDLFGYGSVQGDIQLRFEIVRLLEDWGLTAVSPDDLLITSGVMQGIALVIQVLAKSGEKIVIDEPSYIGVLSIIKAQGLNPIKIQIGHDGPNLDHLETIFKQEKPKIYYTIPNFHNPTGISFSLEKRKAILELANRYEVMIVEDDIYGRLAYDEEPLPSIKQFDTQSRVIYLNGFSKMLMPGIRVGFIVMVPTLKADLLALRRAFDLCGPPFLQRALAEFLRENGFKPHIRKIRPIYKERRDTLLQALQAEMPPSVRWTIPKGGFCNWVSMPRQFAPGELYRLALQRGFAFTPGEAYDINRPQEEHFRLCFGGLTSIGIQATIKQLAQLIRSGSQSSSWLPIV
ncbi:MAG: PLP-dependent aminotransferase family protein [Chloroflexota bacterium]